MPKQIGKKILDRTSIFLAPNFQVVIHMLNLWLSLEGVGEGRMVTRWIFGCPGFTLLNRGSWSFVSIIDGLRSVYLKIQNIPGLGGKGMKLHHFFFFSFLLFCY